MNKKRLLVIEDEISVVKQLKWGPGKDYEIIIASEADEARLLLTTEVFPVAILDLGLPPSPDTPQQGFHLLEGMSALAPYTKVIVITGSSEEKNAIRAIALGAADFCPKPIDLKILKIILSRTFRIYELEEANRRLQRQTTQTGSFYGMLAVSADMGTFFEQIRKVSETDYPVLIAGENGTGKEMAARAIHSQSQRASRPLIIINCGAIPENLLESELFGHEKGAFTGAAGRKIGKFEQADHGTIFLDEIGELSLGLQMKILRFLQEHTIERLGGTKTVTLDARIIAATNTNLEEAVRQGGFREDLFHRLNVVPLKIPSLRERTEDILLLAHRFLQEEVHKLQRGQVTLSPAAASALTLYDWPGNVRELQNRICRALSTNTGRVIEPGDLGLKDAASEQNEKLLTLKSARQEAEINTIRRALAMTGNNISQAAKLLDTSRPTLHDLLRKHGISV